MTIRVTWQADTTPIDELEAFLDSFVDISAEIGQQTLDVIEPDLRNELGYEPGPVKLPIEWTNDDQRMAFFATDGFGSGIGYQRTGKLSGSWVITGRNDGTLFSIIVSNEVDSARFVVGSLAQSIATARRFQQRFHANTGWPLATETVQFWFKAAQETYRKLMLERIAEFGTTRFSQRAYTSPRRR